MTNLQTEVGLEKIVAKYRKRLSLDPVLAIHLRIVEESDVPKGMKKGSLETDAWTTVDSIYPIVHIFIRRSYLARNKAHPRHIIRTLVHELLHIPIGKMCSQLNRKYDYTKHRHARIEEDIVIRLARAIVPVADEKLFDEM